MRQAILNLDDVTGLRKVSGISEVNSNQSTIVTPSFKRLMSFDRRFEGEVSDSTGSAGRIAVAGKFNGRQVSGSLW